MTSDTQLQRISAPGTHGTGGVVCPFDLRVDVVDRMLNFELPDDPDYEGIELQVFDGPPHGKGMVALLKRRADGRIDVLRGPGLAIDPDAFEIGSGLGEWMETDFTSARFAVTPCGTEVDVRFVDAADRTIEVSIDDRDGRRRRPATMLAPVGAAIERPNRLFLVWMKGFDLVRSGRRDPRIRIDGRTASTGRLPGERIHRRRLIKYSADLGVAILNPARNDPAAIVSPDRPGGVELDGRGIAGLSAQEGRHRARFQMDPPLPDIAQMTSGTKVSGAWRLGIDEEPEVIGGLWTAARHGDQVDLLLDVVRGWKPRGLPLLMRAVTRILPIFRTWPTTYRWSATVDLGVEPRVTSRWERKVSERAESYQGFTTSRRR